MGPRGWSRAGAPPGPGGHLCVGGRSTDVADVAGLPDRHRPRARREPRAADPLARGSRRALGGRERRRGGAAPDRGALGRRVLRGVPRVDAFCAACRCFRARRRPVLLRARGREYARVRGRPARTPVDLGGPVARRRGGRSRLLPGRASSRRAHPDDVSRCFTRGCGRVRGRVAGRLSGGRLAPPRRLPGVGGHAHRRVEAAPGPRDRLPRDPARGGLAAQRRPHDEGLLPRAGDHRPRPEPGSAPAPPHLPAAGRLSRRPARARHAHRGGRTPGRRRHFLGAPRGRGADRPRAHRPRRSRGSTGFGGLGSALGSR